MRQLLLGARFMPFCLSLIHIWQHAVDATTLKTEADIQKAVMDTTIFGRVTPTQKRQIIRAFQAQGHTVAMVGDGVNLSLIHI